MLPACGHGDPHRRAQCREAGGTQVRVAGQIPVLFADDNIQNPSFAGFVTTQDHGLLECLLVFTRS